MYSIGEFSRITGLTVKTLRFYHEKEILVPARFDGYRYYDDRNVETARVIVALRELGFSINEIGTILSRYEDDSDILDYLRQKQQTLAEQIRRDREVSQRIDLVIRQEQETQKLMSQSAEQITEKTVAAQLVGGIRMRCRYDEVGKGFSQLGRKVGRYISGSAICLYYDAEYCEEQADLEPCMPLKKQVEVSGVDIRELPESRCVCLTHHGPYDELSRTYTPLMQYVKEKGYEIQLPIREVYLKGPGMIFKGNPKNYITEVQIPIQ